MIYGDSPQKINQLEDKLGLKTYSYAPQLTAVMQSGNLYVYAINNPVNYLDPSGNIALVDDLVVAGLVFLGAAAVYTAAPLLTKILQEMGKTFTDLCNMTAKEIRWLIEWAKSKTADKDVTPTEQPQSKAKYKEPVSGKTGKEAANDVPSWARGERPYEDENGKDFAKRLMDKKYGEGNYDTGPGSEYNKIKKWGDRGFK